MQTADKNLGELYYGIVDHFGRVQLLLLGSHIESFVSATCLVFWWCRWVLALARHRNNV